MPVKNLNCRIVQERTAWRWEIRGGDAVVATGSENSSARARSAALNACFALSMGRKI
ncbi:MAG TPA: hypothetical protein VHN11_13555 [Xanthobacteraceae bacterium]|jgi:hypothetical protein|nr:hypothetical protein [Xanthobacteraceae bacterium]